MKKKIPVVPTVLLSAAALLLAGTTVGSTRAALTYFSENYSASVRDGNPIGDWDHILDSGENVYNSSEEVGE